MTVLRSRLAASLFMMSALALTAMPESAYADPERNKAAVQRAFDAWTAGSGSPFDLLVDNASWTITGNALVSKTYPTREAFMREVIRPFNARMSRSLRPTVRSIHAEGSTVVVYFEAIGTARDGQPYSNSYAWFLDMDAGRVVRGTAFFDTLAFNDLWRRVPPAASN